MIFVIAEHKDNKLKPITSELLVFAQRAGRDFGQPVGADLARRPAEQLRAVGRRTGLAAGIDDELLAVAGRGFHDPRKDLERPLHHWQRGLDADRCDRADDDDHERRG